MTGRLPGLVAVGLVGAAMLGLGACGGAAKTALPPTTTLVSPHPLVTSGLPAGGQTGLAPAPTTSTTVPAGVPATSSPGAAPPATGPGAAGGPTSGVSNHPAATTTTTLPALALGASQDQDGANWVVPQGWTARSGVQTTGTDHLTFVYDSPSEPGANLIIVVTPNCGCVTSDTPAERSQSSATAGTGDVTNIHQVNRSRATFTMTTEAPVWGGIASPALPVGDATDGVVADNDSLHNNPPTNQQASSYVVAVVTLPAARHADATRILNAVYIG